MGGRTLLVIVVVEVAMVVRVDLKEEDDGGWTGARGEGGGIPHT